MKKILFTIILMLIGVFSLVFFAEPVKAQEQNQDIVNLASPDLEDKEYLGNGVYRLIDSTYTLDYNIYNGYLIFNGLYTETIIATIVSTGTNELDTYTIKLTEISGTKTISNNNILLEFSIGKTAVFTNVNSGYTDTFTYNYVRFYFGLSGAFDNYTVKLQLEKGNTATDYQVPIQALEQHIQFEKDKSYDVGYGNGYDNGYGVGYDVGYDVGFNEDSYYLGYYEGYDYGLLIGRQDGEIIGYNLGYDVGYDVGYGAGYDYGYDIGYDNGYDKGLVENPDNNFGTMIRTVLLGVGSILSVELLPHITIGAIISVPIIFGIISFVLGRRKD